MPMKNSLILVARLASRWATLRCCRTTTSAATKLDQAAAQAIHTAAPLSASGAAAHLPGGHVRVAPGDLPDVGVNGGSAEVRIRQTGHAEIQDLGLTVGGDDDVSRLEVAVD